MKKLLSFILLILLVSITSKSNASDTKVNGRLYAHWNMDLSDGAESANSFALKRAYVTVKSKLSNGSTVRITSDIRETSAFDGYSIVLKYAYFDWKPKFGNGVFKARFGLQPLLYSENLNKLWNRRYIEKTVGDKNKFLTSSDIGASAFLNLGEKSKLGYVALQVINGTSYSDTKELNKNKNINLFTLLKPFSNNEDLKRSRIVGQIYFGTQNESFVPTADTSIDIIDTTIIEFANESSQFKHNIFSLGGMLGYRNNFDIGFETNFKTSGIGYDSTGAELDDINSSGVSLFGTLYFEEFSAPNSFVGSLNLFGRYDKFDKDTDIDNNGETAIIIGLECINAKGFKTSINFRTTSYEMDGEKSESELFLNTLFKF